MGQKKNVDMSAQETKVKVVKTPEETKATKAKSGQKSSQKVRSKKFVATRAQVDKTKEYDTFAAVEMIKKLSYSKFDGSVEAHLVVRKAGSSFNLSLPHSTGKSIRVVIADDKLLKQIEAGKFDFDVLLTTPAMMPKLTKHARVLGPKGLMPNPKNGTLTDKPEDKKKELEAGKITVKTEKKAPLVHLLIGKVSMETKQLVENLNYLIKVLKADLVKLSISATMSPGIKVKID